MCENSRGVVSRGVEVLAEEREAARPGLPEVLYECSSSEWAMETGLLGGLGPPLSKVPNVGVWFAGKEGKRDIISGRGGSSGRRP